MDRHDTTEQDRARPDTGRTRRHARGRALETLHAIHRTIASLTEMAGVDTTLLSKPAPERKRKADRIAERMQGPPPKRPATSYQWTPDQLVAFQEEMQGCEAADLGPG